MPTIEIDLEDLECLIGRELPKDKEEINKLFLYLKSEAKTIEGKKIQIEFKDTNRADIWGVEGIARALQGFLGLETGIRDYTIFGRSEVEVRVDQRLEEIRPFIGCSTVMDVDLTDVAIRQIMHFQDKLDQTCGRNRSRTSIGLYNYDLIKPPLIYGVSKPMETKFVPLDFTKELTLKEILKTHPKGIKYGNLVSSHSLWPIFKDSENKILSFPPIINSNDLGRITSKTRNILVEVTGTSYAMVLNTLNNIILALSDRGGNIYSTLIHYPYTDLKDEITPQLKTDTIRLEYDDVTRTIGVKLSPFEIRSLIQKARYGIETFNNSSILVKIPCYRVDILHYIDIIEDIAIAYNFNKIEPRWPKLDTIGDLLPITHYRDLVREVMIGLGCQEILTYIMTSLEALFIKMNLKLQRVIEVENPKISSKACIRNWLIPSLLEFLSHNVHVEYPQRVFEIGYCVNYDKTKNNKTIELEKLSSIFIHSKASFTEAKAILDGLLLNIGTTYKLRKTEHSSFIEGRIGEILIQKKHVGIIGEIHPRVLQNWGLENPASGFEINLTEINMI